MLRYHLVLVTKYRHPVITDELESFLKKYTKKYFSKQKCRILEMETDIDHIHILFNGNPNIRLSDFINAYKSASSRNVRKEFSETLKPYYWKPYFWSNSYFICGVSEQSESIVQAYIQNQKANSSHN